MTLSSISDTPRQKLTDALITVVVPCYNEGACFPVFLQRLESALSAVPDIDYEILAVNDGSKDDTAAVLENRRLRDRRLGIIQFVRNFGHQAALSAGLAHAHGDAVICMDADLQHPPELLPELIRLWRRGFDVVQTVRRSQPGLTKSLSSRAFYFLLNFFSEVELTNGAADFRLMSRRAVDSLLALPERSRFLRGLVAWLGFPCTTIEYDAPPRLAGSSTYSLKKMMDFAVDGLVALSARPLQLALWLAGGALLLALAYTIYVFSLMANGIPLVKGWASTIFLILIMGSVNLLCTGILGLYLRAALVEIRKRPDYLISGYMPPAHSLGPEHASQVEESSLPTEGRLLARDA
jgi:polyisoprenyl-phosphate glycosyltransferase